MLEKILENKRVLFIPVYSMRDRQTNAYYLDKDGNYARILSLLYKTNFKRATVLIPEQSAFRKRDDLKNVNFVRSLGYGINANATRKAIADWMPTFSYIDIDNYDYVVIEPNYLTKVLCDSKFKHKLIYWCVASCTSEGTPWFVKEFEAIDKELAYLVPTAVASKSQVDALKGKAFYEENFYDASLFDYQTIFFPFRLTDENYHAEEVANILERLQERTDLKPFKVLYTDVNNSGLFDDKKNFVKISGDHDVYLQILKGRPIIPYFENMDMLEHISINEFIYYNCEVIALNCRHKKATDNIIYIDNISSLYETLVNKLKQGEHV